MENKFLDPKDQQNNESEPNSQEVNHQSLSEDADQEEDAEDWEGDYDEQDDAYDSYGHSGEKYGWYNGYSDDVIDDAFEGDPENTWNVD